MKSYVEKIFIIEGIILGIIGLLFFANPVESFFNFTSICGILIIICSIVRIIRGFKSDSKLFYTLTGLIDILFGLIIYFNPVSTVGSLILLYGIWALVKGLYNIIICIKNRCFGFNVQTGLSILSILLGSMIALCPIAILFALPYVPYAIGVCFIVLAASEIYIGYKL